MTYYSEREEAIMSLQENLSSIDVLQAHRLNNFVCKLCDRKMVVDIKHAELVCPQCWQVTRLDDYSVFSIQECIKNQSQKRHTSSRCCPYCKSKKITLNGSFKTKFCGKVIKFRCIECGKQHSSRNNTPFKWKHFFKDVYLFSIKLSLIGIQKNMVVALTKKKFGSSPSRSHLYRLEKEDDLVILINREDLSRLKEMNEEYHQIRKFNRGRSGYNLGIGRLANNYLIELEEPKPILE